MRKILYVCFAGLLLLSAGCGGVQRVVQQGPKANLRLCVYKYPVLPLFSKGMLQNTLGEAFESVTDVASENNVDNCDLMAATGSKIGFLGNIWFSDIYSAHSKKLLLHVETGRRLLLSTPGTLAAKLREAFSEGTALHNQVIAERGGVQAPAPIATAESFPLPAAAAANAIRTDIDDLSAYQAPARAKAHAVVIGIRSYRQKLPEADFADRDARLVSKYLTQALGYQEENVATLINDQAAKSDFEKYFERWLLNRVEKDDEVFVYYSGHGAPNPATGDAYLVPYDGDPTYLKETAYSLDRMYAQLAKLPSQKITVVMDSCFSGAGGHSVIAKGARPLVTVVSNGNLPANITVLSASAGDQISHSYDEKGHGLFTYFFLKGIGQQASNGAVDMKQVFDYAAPQVSKVARRDYNSDQVPQWKSEGR